MKLGENDEVRGQKDQDGTQMHADSSQTVAIMFSLRVNLHQLPLTVPLIVRIGRKKFVKL